jgi:hypothetical protein
MYDKGLGFEVELKSLKKSLASFEKINCRGEDLAGTNFRPDMYSNDLILYRDEDDKFIHILDRSDGIESKVTIDDFKVIINNIVVRIVEETYELDELDRFLSLEDGE